LGESFAREEYWGRFKQQEIRKLRGKIKWESDLSEMSGAE
jgi:hypothetical protein